MGSDKGYISVAIATDLGTCLKHDCMTVDDIELPAEECAFARHARRYGISYIDIADDIPAVTNPAQLVPHVIGEIESNADVPPVDDDKAYNDDDLLLYLLEQENMYYEQVADALYCQPESVRNADPRDEPDPPHPANSPLVTKLQKKELKTDSLLNTLFSEGNPAREEAEDNVDDDDVFDSEPVTIPIEGTSPPAENDEVSRITEMVINPEPGEIVTLRDSGDEAVVEWVDSENDPTEVVLEDHPLGSVYKRDIVEYSKDLEEN